ncbi:MAG: DUF2155 domain-containing protein [Pseudomonadota bacterium]
MIRPATILAALLFPLVAGASTTTEPNLMGEAVELRALDKVTARTFDYTVPLGETLNFGSLTIHARHCEKTPPTELPETYAFLQIDDRRLTEEGAESEEGARIFSGWMFASRPAISALDHRVYDVWVIGCVTKPGIADLRR